MMLKCLKEPHDVMPDVRLVGDKWVQLVCVQLIKALTDKKPGNGH